MTFVDQIGKLYKKSGYLDRYGGSVVISILIILCFLSIFTYHYVWGFLNPIKTRWDIEKCNPKYMPFAGYLSTNGGSDKFNYASKNFSECVARTLKDVTRTAVTPITAAANGVMNVQQTNLNSLQGVRYQIKYIRIQMIKAVKNIMNRLIGFVMPTQTVMLKIRDLFARSVGVMTASFYTFLGFMHTLKSSMRYIITTIITFLVALAASVSLQFAVPFNFKLAQMGLQFFLLLAVPAGIVSHWFEQTFAITAKQTIPPNPRCFDKNTEINTTNGIKKISELKNGDQLTNGGKVTTILKLLREGERVFNLNDVIVTGSHMVYDNERGWILVSEHANSKEIKDYNEEYVYCINTDTKMISIANNLFLDWDETNITDFLNLKQKTGIKRKSDIHKFLDGGFKDDTLLEMKDGTKKQIKDIKIKDILKNGEKVLGIAKIDTTNLNHIKNYKKLGIIGGPNLQLVNNLGNVSTYNISGDRVNISSELYHLVTDTKTLSVGKNKFLDFNGSLEVFDDI